MEVKSLLRVFIKLQRKVKSKANTYDVLVQSTHEAVVLFVVVLEGRSFTQLREGIDDDTEHDVQNDGRDDQEKDDVEEQLD